MKRIIGRLAWPVFAFGVFALSGAIIALAATGDL